MRMRRHRVPVRSLLEQRESHHQLTALDALAMNRLVDRALVARRHRAQPHRLNLAEPHHRRRILRVRQIAQQIKLRGLTRAVTRKRNILAPAPHIQAVQLAQLELLAIDRHRARAADVQHAKLAPLQKELRRAALAKSPASAPRLSARLRPPPRGPDPHTPASPRPAGTSPPAETSRATPPSSSADTAPDPPSATASSSSPSQNPQRPAAPEAALAGSSTFITKIVIVCPGASIDWCGVPAGM